MEVALLDLRKGGLEDNEASLGTTAVGVVVESTVFEGVICAFKEGLLENVLRKVEEIGGGMASLLADESSATAYFFLGLLDGGGGGGAVGTNASEGKVREVLFWVLDTEGLGTGGA